MGRRIGRVMKYRIVYGLILGLTVYSQAAAKVPEEARKHLTWGTTALEDAQDYGGFKKTAEEYLAAAQLAPQWADPRYCLGVVDSKLGDWDNALENYKQYLKLSPHAKDADAVKAKIKQIEFARNNPMASDSNGFGTGLSSEEKITKTEIFGGLGLNLASQGEIKIVDSVFPGGPGEKAGIKSGDQIVKIGDQDAGLMSNNEAVSQLRGRPGTQVTLSVKQSGNEKLKVFTLTRAKISVTTYAAETSVGSNGSRTVTTRKTMKIINPPGK